ncbi:hypothetical protein N7470_003603 [Penicillium chermesinum]|nr:hypothetical protein N7470_003603 [Penicillium chermesinum]
MAINPDDVNYTPPSSVGREIGIMFAFIGAFLVTVVLYGLAWRIHQNRTHKEDIAHRKAFLSRIAPTANSSLDFDSSLGTTATVTAGSHNSYTAVRYLSSGRARTRLSLIGTGLWGTAPSYRCTAARCRMRTRSG